MLPRQRLTQAPGWMLSTLQKKQWGSVRRRLEGHTHTHSLKDGGPGRAGYRLHEEPSNCSVPPTLYHLLCPALFSYKASACPFGTINSFSIAVMRPWSYFSSEASEGQRGPRASSSYRQISSRARTRPRFLIPELQAISSSAVFPPTAVSKVKC